MVKDYSITSPPLLASRPYQVLTLTAKNKRDMDVAVLQHLDHWKRFPQTSFVDASSPVQIDQQEGSYRCAAVCQDLEDAISVFEEQNPQRILRGNPAQKSNGVVFLFSGQGTQYLNMGREIYHCEPFFRTLVDYCAEKLKTILGSDIRAVLYPEDTYAEIAQEQMRQTIVSQPTIFVVEYALARLWMHWGIIPQAMIGHSIGEYVGACLAGVFSLDDALDLVAIRSLHIQQQSVGAMLSIMISEQDLLPFLSETVVLASVNSPMHCVVAGPYESLSPLEKRCQAEGIVTHWLRTSHAFHSPMISPVVDPLRTQLRRIKLHSPRIPLITNVTGTWITAEEATSPEHWCKEMLQTVRFAQGIQTLLREYDAPLLEIGAGRTLTTLARQQQASLSDDRIYTSLRHPHDASSDVELLLSTLARLWVNGAEVDWARMHSQEQRHHSDLSLSAHRGDREPLSIQETFHGFSSASRSVSAFDSSNECEAAIARIWGDVLHINPVQDYLGLHENFFKRGGDSLLAGQLHVRLCNDFCIDMSIATIFEHPTIASLAEIIGCNQVVAEYQPILPLNSSDYTEYKAYLQSAGQLTSQETDWLENNKGFYLSSAQQRLWLQDQLQPGSTVYHIPIAYRFMGIWKMEIVERCLNEIIRRHEILRTTFSLIADQPVQIIAPLLQITIASKDLRSVPQEQKAAELQQVANEEARHLFNLSTGPLLRAMVMHVGHEEHILVLTIHHIIADGWSLGILQQELATLYTAYTHNQPSPLPDLPVQYSDYSAWERTWLQCDVLQRDKTYWQQQLTGIPPALLLPTDYPRPDVETFTGTYDVFLLPYDNVVALKALSQREGITLFMIAMAAFQILMAYYSHQEDIVVGTDTAHRHHVELENLIGFFVNQLVLRTSLSGNPSCLELMQRVRASVIGAYEHQSVPFDQLVRLINPPRFPNRSPLFQVKLDLQNLPTYTESLIFERDSLLIDPDAAQLDLLLALTETATGLQGVWQYNTDLFKASTIQQMTHRYIVLLKAIVADPSDSLSTLYTLLDKVGMQWRIEQKKDLSEKKHKRFKQAYSKPVTVITQGD